MHIGVSPLKVFARDDADYTVSSAIWPCAHGRSFDSWIVCQRIPKSAVQTFQQTDEASLFSAQRFGVEPSRQASRKTNLAEPTRSEILIPSGSQSEFPDERVRDWLARREGDASLGGLEPGRGNVVGMRLDGGRR